MLQLHTTESQGEEVMAGLAVAESEITNAQTETDRARFMRRWWSQFRSILFDHDPRNLVQRIALVILLYLVAFLGREALHMLIPGSVRYLTFFPALLAAGLLCGFFPSIVLLAAFSITSVFWIEPAEVTVPLHMQVALTLTFALAGCAVIIPAVYSVNAHRRLIRQDEQLSLVNEELRHRLKNLFAVTSSICVQSLKEGHSKEEISHDVIGRIQAIASAQDLLSITSKEGSNLGDLVHAIVGPLCPDPARLEIKGEFIALPSDATTSFALILHELSTNAIKYGAWRADSASSVEIEWRTERGKLWFSWHERAVQVSSSQDRRRGFGTRLFEQSLRGSKIVHELGPEGVQCTIAMEA